ncbi:MAG: hypothetical protein MMC23_008210 [Stictis urceolatum]|nr:hypothetical protein [Stictis urceolata]
MAGETYLITGSTGGLGSTVLSHLRRTLPPTSTLIASSSSPSKEPHFTSQGYSFRVANFDSPQTLLSAFTGVDKLLFVSSDTFDNEKRSLQHQRVVSAAKAAGVGHVYYTSLAFGGLGDGSKVAVQAAHLETERMLEDSGVGYTSVREGLYADAFPLFLDWYPDSREVLVPGTGEGGLAVALRAELGEATANLMRTGRWDREKKVLLSGTEAVSMRDMVGVINEVTGKEVRVRTVGGEEYVRERVKASRGENGEGFFRSRLSWFEGLEKGDGAVTTGTLREALGREPVGGREAIRKLLVETGGEYRWHQNEKIGK